MEKDDTRIEKRKTTTTKGNKELASKFSHFFLQTLEVVRVKDGANKWGRTPGWAGVFL